MDDFPRLIEHGFPLRETSLASVHEKNVRRGHISTLHIWPARRPLAACRAALVATLLPDPGDPAKRAEIFKRLAGIAPRDAISAKAIEGGILRWGNENGSDLKWFRDEIRKAYGGRAPRVLDPFAGGGAIPLEAMRLGCDATAMDINPVAWFILKCTLEYPQRFAGKLLPLPNFEAMPDEIPRLNIDEGEFGDLAAHVRSWGRWVLERARAKLSAYYPTVDGKPTVAYLWARTVICKNCRAAVPLLKTRWLCNSGTKAIALTMRPMPGVGVEFDVVTLDKKQQGRYDASGTMNSSGVRCPCCPAQITMAELRTEAKLGRMAAVMTAVVVDGPAGKEYRGPTALEREQAEVSTEALDDIFSTIPFGIPSESLPTAEALGFRVPLYGIDRWHKMFTSRQLLALGTFLSAIRAARVEMITGGYDDAWMEAVTAYLQCGFARMLDFNSKSVSWISSVEAIGHVFVRYALPFTWDSAEAAIINTCRGGWGQCLEAILASFKTASLATAEALLPTVLLRSVLQLNEVEAYDVILTDPPYYDSIPFSDLMDYFFVWMRRQLAEGPAGKSANYLPAETPKWNSDKSDGEIIDDSSRFGGDKIASRESYEKSMTLAFQASHRALRSNGRFVVVFAHKNPDAWEALVSGIIAAGFAVDGSWAIATEQAARMRAQTSAALASSIWIVCKKRDRTARPGWDSSVREEMRANVAQRLRDFWDAGIRGPDFVWSAIGPALEAFSKYPRVRKVDNPDESMTVAEFLADVRREVVGFAAARVLGHSDDADSGIDGPTTYYLLHRNDFGLRPVPVGASILYAVSCNLRDTTLIDEYDLLFRPGRVAKITPAADEEVEDDTSIAGLEVADSIQARSPKTDKSLVQLKQWNDRKRPSLGEDAVGRPAPLIDQIHRLMRLWKSGDVSKVNDYIAARGLSSDRRAREVIQALIELAERGSEERSVLEGLSNHLGDARTAEQATPTLF